MESILEHRNYAANTDTMVSILHDEMEVREAVEEALNGPGMRKAADRNSRDYTRWVQQSLNRTMGVHLAVDGIAGKKTRAALRSFQRRNRLPATGQLNTSTERALIVAGATPPPHTGSVPTPTAATAGIPTLARPRDVNPPSYTIYPNIPLQIRLGQVNSMTGIFIPENYCLRSPVDIIVYLHGYKVRAHKTSYSVDQYLRERQFRLREAVNQSQRNVILVAPTLGPKNEAGILLTPQGFDSFIDQVLATIKHHGPFAGSTQTPRLGSLILACHSGSGGYMRMIATGGSRYAGNIRECWGFDPDNNRDQTQWRGWAQWTRSDPQRRLYIYYTNGSRAQNMANDLVRLNPQSIQSFRSRVGHDDIPARYLAERIQGAPFLLDKHTCPASPNSYVEQELMDDEALSFESQDEEADNPPPLSTSLSLRVTKPPQPVPPSNPVPFAPHPPAGSYWPLRSPHKEGRRVSYRASDGTIVGGEERMFLARRKTKKNNQTIERWHVGIDLLAKPGDEVVACEDGTIVGFGFFYKAKSGQPTYQLLVEHSRVVVNYGEVTGDSLSRHGLQKGMRVKAGQPIAFVSDTEMLHFETYKKGTSHSHRWWKHEPKPPSQLLNPTRYLLFLQEHGSPTSGARQPSTHPPGPQSSQRSRDYIRWVQHSLNRIMGLRLVEDGVLGPKTRNAIRAFQRRKRLRVDGTVGSHTERALLAAGAVPPDKSGTVPPPVPSSVPKGTDALVRQTLAMAARPVPGLGITLGQLLQRHQPEARGIPMDVLLAFIRKEAGNKLFDDATAGKWNETSQKYIPSFYELGVFQTPGGLHGCKGAPGGKRCNYAPPGYDVNKSSFGKGWYRIAGTYPTATNWQDPVMQVRIGLWSLTNTAERVAGEFPDLFPSKSSEWYLRMALLYSFSKGAGWTRAFLKTYRSQLRALPESQRWNFLRGKTAHFKGRDYSRTKVFDPENVDEKMALAAKLRAFRGAAPYPSLLPTEVHGTREDKEGDLAFKTPGSDSMRRVRNRHSIKLALR